MSKFYYGDKVRISNANVSDGAYGTVIGKVSERGQYALTKENSNSNKENSDAFSYFRPLYYTRRRLQLYLGTFL